MPYCDRCKENKGLRHMLEHSDPCRVCHGYGNDAFRCRCSKDQGPGFLFMFLIFMFAALAQCSTCKAQVPEPTRMTLADGSTGLWFSDSDATRILSVWREANDLRLRIPVLEAMIENRNMRIELTERSLELADRQVEILTRTNENLASISAPRWYTSPWLWLAVGLVLGVSATVAIGTLQ